MWFWKVSFFWVFIWFFKKLSMVLRMAFPHEESRNLMTRNSSQGIHPPNIKGFLAKIRLKTEKNAKFYIWKNLIHKNVIKIDEGFKNHLPLTKYGTFFGWKKSWKFFVHFFGWIRCSFEVKKFLEYSSFLDKEFHVFPRSSQGIKNQGKCHAYSESASKLYLRTMLISNI